MNDTRAARELVAAAREPEAARVLTPGVYMGWAPEAMEAIVRPMFQATEHMKSAQEYTSGKDRELDSPQADG